MTFQSRTVLALCAALLSLAACQAPQPSSASAPGHFAQIDANFMAQAATNGQAQVTFARLAQTRAVDSSLRAFATQTIRDHATIDHQLAALAQANGVTLPSGMDPQHQHFYHQLEALRGVAFDRTYIERQLQNQTMAIKAYQTEARSGKDPQVRSFAQQTLPTLIKRLRLLNASGGYLLTPGALSEAPTH